MTDTPPSFFDAPILNSPYLRPTRHWDLEDGRPTDTILATRRRAELISAIPPSKKKGKGGAAETDPVLAGIIRQTDPTPVINRLRQELETWRQLPNPAQWQVSPVTATLLRHWRALAADRTRPIRPFFCQLEAVEAAIWLAEVAPRTARGKFYLDWLAGVNGDAAGAGARSLPRVALKLATGAGKTTVMAMLIAWQAINAARARNSKHFSRAFLAIAPGITIRDRLRVLLPSDGDNLYRRQGLVPTEFLPELGQAKVVIANYHQFGLRETMELAKGTRQALAGHGGPLATGESEGAMLARVARELMALGPIVVLNDEAHHCYRERPGVALKLSAEEKAEAKDNEEAARLWISGIEAAQRRLGLVAVYDLSACSPASAAPCRRSSSTSSSPTRCAS